MRGFGLGIGAMALTIAGAAAAAEDPPSCAKVGGQTRSVVRTDLRQLPAVGVESRAEVGQPMISAGGQVIYGRQITLETPLQVDGAPAAYAKRGRVETPGKYRFDFRVEPGWYPYNGAFPGIEGEPMSVWEVPGQLPVGLGGRRYERGRIGLEAAGKDHLRVVWTIDRAHWKSAPLPARYREATCWGPALGGLRRELIYDGVAGQTVLMRYREFGDDPARPVLVRELRFDLSQGREISFRDTRFEVIEAGAAAIRFKVIRPLV